MEFLNKTLLQYFNLSELMVSDLAKLSLNSIKAYFNSGYVALPDQTPDSANSYSARTIVPSKSQPHISHIHPGQEDTFCFSSPAP